MLAHQKNLPSGQAIFKKVYTLASIFFQRFYVYTCLHSFFFSYHFAGTLSPPGSGHFSTVPLCFSSAFFLLVFLRLFRNHFSSTLPADIYTFLHLFKPFAAHFLHFFFFVHYRECRPSMKSILEEKSCKIEKKRDIHSTIF